MDERPRQPDESQPQDYKTAADGRGGLIRVRFRGGPHEGRSLYIDEMELPRAIYTTAAGRPFEWWPDQLHEVMAATPAGSDPSALPVRHELELPEDTGEPAYVAVGLPAAS